MPHYLSPDPDALINGESILALIAGMSSMENIARRFLSQNGIEDPKPGQWYPYQQWLYTFEAIEEKFGTSTLYFIGLQVVNHSIFPPANTLEEALQGLQTAFEANVKGKDMGSYQLLESGQDLIKLRSSTLSPCDFDRGIITGLTRKFKPQNASIVYVEVDKTVLNKKDGAKSSTYLISW
ncbi:MAG: hypothetical protein ACO1OQ_06965 [Rufibacter sp.]